MQIIDLTISEQQLAELKQKFPKQGKNSHIGNIAVEVAKIYFLVDSNQQAEIKAGKMGADITVCLNGIETSYEIKGTEDSKISFSKLKVSGIACYNALVNGMLLIRVTNIGNVNMKIYIMKCGEDFELVEEPRWALKRIKKEKQAIYKPKSKIKQI